MNVQLHTTCQCSLLARPDGQPVGEFLLIPFGTVHVDRALSGSDFVFQRQHAESAVRWFDRMGRKLAIDYEHQTFDRYNTRPDGLRPAAGWIARLEIRDDGLWACGVTWTDRAKELLRSGEYQYFSPVIYWVDDDYTDVAALGPVALTNDPAMRGARPLVAARAEDSALDDAETPLAADVEVLSCADENAVDPPEDASGHDVAPAPVETPTERADSRCASELSRGDTDGYPIEDDDTRVAVLRAEIDVLNEEIEMLHRQLRAQEADAFVERGMRLGKILDGTSMDWRADYQRDPAETEARLARAPVLLPPGRMIPRDARGVPVPLSRAVGDTPNHFGAAPRIVEPEDLEAYERARAAGRIHLLGVPS